MKSIKELTAELHKLRKENTDLLDLADKEQEGVLTAEQDEVYERRDKEIDELSNKLDQLHKGGARREKLNRLSDQAKEIIGRQTTTTPPGSALNVKDNASVIKLAISKQELFLRPGTLDHARAQDEYQQSFNNYLLTGEKEGLRDWQALGLQVGANPKGGYLASMTFITQLIKFLDDQVFMRRLASVFPNVSPVGMGAPSYDSDPGDADWTPEVPASDISEDDTAAVGRRELIPKDLSKLIKNSTKLLSGNPTMNVETFMAQRLAYKIAIPEEKGFISGGGGKDPLGVFTPSAFGIDTDRDVSTGATTSFDADAVIDCFFNLKEQYMRNATWLVSREWVKRARKLKTSQGNYIWSPATAGTPSAILERPYFMSEYVPNTYTTGKYIAIVGDFSFYWIADGFDLTIERLDQLFRLKKQIGFLAEKSTDGAPVLGEAFSRMKTA